MALELNALFVDYVMIPEGGIPPLLFAMNIGVTAMVDSIVGLRWIP